MDQQQQKQTDLNQNIQLDNTLAGLSNLPGLEGIDLSTLGNLGGVSNTGNLGGLGLPPDLMASLAASSGQPLGADLTGGLHGYPGHQLQNHHYDNRSNLANATTNPSTAHNMTNPLTSTEQLLSEKLTPDLNLANNHLGTDLNQLLAGTADLSALSNLPPLPNLGLQTQNHLLDLQTLPFSNPMNMGMGGQQFSGLGGLGLGNQAALNPAFRPQSFVPGSAAHRAQFHQKGPDNEIKLFVGGLAFQTQESDLIQYFKSHGHVADAIVMRDPATGKGRGFAFVKMQFENRQKAQDNKSRLIALNHDGSHMINDKRVDVKSADDYVKPQPGQPGAMPPRQQFPQYGMGGMPGGQQGHPHHQMMPGQQFPPKPHQGVVQDPAINKPNPYVIVETRNGNEHHDAEGRDKKEILFKYPKSKIFVGGLDFRLENKDLEQHFKQYGDIESAVILKDINSGTSRGFGFVTFKDEAVAQDLIKNMQTTNIGGRKVDIKSAEPKQQNANQPPNVPPKRIPQYGQNQGGNQNGYAVIPQYGGDGGNRRNHYNDDFGNDSQGSSRGENSFQRDRRGGRDAHYRRNDNGGDRGHRTDRRTQHRDRDQHHHRSDRDGRRNHGGYRNNRRYSRSRSDSGDSRGSSSSYQKSREKDQRRQRRERDRRGPHHGQTKPVANAPPVEKQNNSSQHSDNRSRSR